MNVRQTLVVASRHAKRQSVVLERTAKPGQERPPARPGARSAQPASRSTCWRLGSAARPGRHRLPGGRGYLGRQAARHAGQPSRAESRSGPVFHGPPRAWRVPPSHGGCASQPSWRRPARQRDAASRRHRVPSRPTQAAQQFVQRQPPPGTRQFGSHFQNAGSRAPVRGFVRRCLNPSRLPTYDSTAFFAAWSPRPFCDSGSLTASGFWPTSASALTESDESTSVAAER
jgi:hypothetical protein